MAERACPLGGANTMDFEDYLTAEKANIQQIRNLPDFSILIPLVNQFYNLSIDLVSPNASPFYGKCLLLCHKGFLSAASLIGRALPEDSSPVTRRAIEIAEVAFAVKYDQNNYEIWLSYEQRMARWEARTAEQKPRKPIFPKLNIPIDHPVLEYLKKSKGIYSDSDVHFTPEYLETREWKEGDSRLSLNYFTSDQRTFSRSVVDLTGTHRMLLLIFDKCMDEAFSTNEEWQRLHDELLIKGQRFAQKFERPEI